MQGSLLPYRNVLGTIVTSLNELNDAFAEFPAWSVAVQTTEVVAIGNVEPEAAAQDSAGDASRLSLTVAV